MARGQRGGALGPLRPPALMIPASLMFAGQLHVNGLSLTAVGTEIAATVFELLQVFDGVCASGRGHSPHSKWQRHLYKNMVTVRILV